MGPEPRIVSPSPEPRTALPYSPRKRKRDQVAAEELEVDVTAPEPPSKKALRKAKKNKTPPNPPATKPFEPSKPHSDSDDEVSAKPAPAPAPAKRSDHGIWIGNLPWSATKADVRTFLTKDTTITEDQITRLHMPAPSEAATAASRQKIKPQNKGFAYVDFSTASALSEALALSESLLTGRRVLIKDSKSFEGRPEKAKEEGDQGPLTKYAGKPPSKRVFVGNLGFETTKKELLEHFARCGAVADAFVATFEDSGKCKGYAWVEFEELKGGEAAVRGWVDLVEVKMGNESEEDGSEGGKEDNMKPKRKPKPRKWWINKLHGRPLKLEFAEDKAVRYKKRFGKEGIATKAKNDAESPPEAASAADSAQQLDGGARHDSNTEPRSQRAYPERRVDARTIKPGAALAAAPRLTGGIVPSLGKKIVFG